MENKNGAKILKIIYIVKFLNLNIIAGDIILNAEKSPSLAHLQKQGSSVRVRCHCGRTSMYHRGHWWTRHRYWVPYMDWGPRHTPPTWTQPHLDMHQHQCIANTQAKTPFYQPILLYTFILNYLPTSYIHNKFEISYSCLLLYLIKFDTLYHTLMIKFKIL